MKKTSKDEKICCMRDRQKGEIVQHGARVGSAVYLRKARNGNRLVLGALDVCDIGKDGIAVARKR